MHGTGIKTGPTLLFVSITVSETKHTHIVLFVAALLSFLAVTNEFSVSVSEATDFAVSFRDARVPEGWAQVEFCASRSGIYVWSAMYVYARESSLNATRWILIGRSMTAPPPMLSPSSILPAPSHHAFIPLKKKFGARFKNSTFQLVCRFKIA